MLIRECKNIEIDWKKGVNMINFDEEIKKFHPSLEVDQAEDAIYNNNVKDMTDVMIDMLKELKDNN